MINDVSSAMCDRRPFPTSGTKPPKHRRVVLGNTLGFQNMNWHAFASAASTVWSGWFNLPALYGQGSTGGAANTNFAEENGKQKLHYKFFRF